MGMIFKLLIQIQIWMETLATTYNFELRISTSFHISLHKANSLLSQDLIIIIIIIIIIIKPLKSARQRWRTMTRESNHKLRNKNVSIAIAIDALLLVNRKSQQVLVAV